VVFFSETERSALDDEKLLAHALTERSALEFDVAAGSIQSLPDAKLPWQRVSLQSAIHVAGFGILVCGGVDVSALERQQRGWLLTTAFLYSPFTRQFSQLPPMKRARCSVRAVARAIQHSSAAAANVSRDGQAPIVHYLDRATRPDGLGIVIVVGGQEAGVNTAAEYFDLDRRKWFDLPTQNVPHMPTSAVRIERNGSAKMVCFDRKGHVACSLDLAKLTWDAWSPIPEATFSAQQSAFAVHEASGRIFCVSCKSSDHKDSASMLHRWSQGLASWKQLADPPSIGGLRSHQWQLAGQRLEGTHARCLFVRP
jgi:hypothetical protein